MAFTKMMATAAAVVGFAPLALAGYDASITNNMAVYWGQNSAGTASSQQRLSAYCEMSEVNIIPVAFLNGLGTPSVNFANAGDNCTAIAGSSLLDCPQIEEDIPICQELGKTILISMGGATYSEGGFSDSASAEAAADDVWGLFGPDTSYPNRPFGSAVVDGFDFDFESAVGNMVPFAERLIANIETDPSKKYYITAAPQCFYPDAAMDEMLNGPIPFDFIMIQFYNNWCGCNNYVPGAATQDAFNFDVWDTWAAGSANPDVKILLGAPANTGAAGSGYVDAATLVEIAEYSSQFASFAGVMLWDMSQAMTNGDFLTTVYEGLPA